MFGQAKEGASKGSYERMGLRVTGAIVAKSAKQSPRENRYIAPQGPVLDIIEIVFDATR
jgi:hypothetical protein